MPKYRPNAVRASIWSRGRSAVRAPIRHDVAIRAAVFPEMASVYSRSVRATWKAERTSATWPWQSSPRVEASSPAISVPNPAAISADRASRKSPATMATRLPNRELTLSTFRRIVASSMTSSW